MLSVNPPLTTFQCLNQSVWNLIYHGTWAHLNGVLHKSLPLVCVLYVYPCISLLDNGSVKTLTRQTILTQQQMNCWTRRFLWGPCRIKGKQAISSSQNFFLNIIHKILKFKRIKMPSVGEEAATVLWRHPNRVSEIISTKWTFSRELLYLLIMCFSLRLKIHVSQPQHEFRSA
jgi:hypothetical protein